LNKFFKKNNYFISIIFFPSIYLLGWLIVSILINPFPNLNSNKSLYGTIFTFIIFLLSLPNWCKYKWGKDLFQILGLNNFKEKKFLSFLVFEFLKSFIIILSICSLAVLGGYASFIYQFKYSIILNSIFLGFLVGFAEELVFRVWLFEELNLFFKKKYANLLQAFIFSLVHIRLGIDLVSNIQLLVGLFLLGLYLNQWRQNKFKSILLPICFHASIVSLWFLISTSFVEIQTNIPKILFGPGEGIQINPIGGIFGILIIFMLCFFKDINFKKLFQ
tara:strand:- start:247 stop:1071 length:825 start_codon:yes stop_codon:yes gene_type:complete